jgi:hypothetical protein
LGFYLPTIDDFDGQTYRRAGLSLFDAERSAKAIEATFF